MGYQSAGAPGAGTDEVQTITATGTPTGGTFRLSCGGFVTAALPALATAAQIDTALEALTPIGAGGVVCAGGPLVTAPVTVTFSGASTAKSSQPALAVVDAALTGGTNPAVAVARTTPGVGPTGQGAAKGALLTDTTAGKLYINTGTPAAPVWTVVGAQT